MTNETPALSICLEEYEYPYPVQFFPLTSDLQPLKMAYMDVPPGKEPNGKTVVLFHWMAATTCDALWDWSGHGTMSVVIDAASCTNGLLDDVKNYLDDEHRARLEQITRWTPSRGATACPRR